MSWQKELDELNVKRALAKRMGGAEGIERQHGRGKLTVRERIDRLFDKDSIEEFKSSVGDAQYSEDHVLQSFRPGNVIGGYARIDGRPVCWRGDDFSIRGGSSDAAGTSKRSIENSARDRRLPLIKLLDGAGGSVREVAGERDMTGSDAVARTLTDKAEEALVQLDDQRVVGGFSVPQTFDHSNISSMIHSELTRLADDNILAQIPVIAAVLGSCAGWIAIAAAESHFSIMTKRTSELFVAGPPMIKQAQRTEIDKHTLGNWEIHVSKTGVVSNVAEDEEDAFRQIRQFLSYLPQNVWQIPPRTKPTDDPNRREEQLLAIIPKERRRIYNIRKLIDMVVDNGASFEISPLSGRALVTLLTRIDGFPVALMANDGRHDGGAMTAAACRKMERFVDLADTFHLPIVYLIDVPGFMIGERAEQEATLKWAARANQAVYEAKVPFISILMRRFYGVAMSGAKSNRGMNVKYAWPSMESGSLPAAGGVMAAYRRAIEAADDPDATRIAMEERLNALASVLRRPQLVDEVIDPRDTRPVLVDFVRQAQAIIATQLGPKILVGMRP